MLITQTKCDNRINTDSDKEIQYVIISVYSNADDTAVRLP